MIRDIAKKMSSSTTINCSMVRSTLRAPRSCFLSQKRKVRGGPRDLTQYPKDIQVRWMSFYRKHSTICSDKREMYRLPQDIGLGATGAKMDEATAVASTTEATPTPNGSNSCRSVRKIARRIFSSRSRNPSGHCVDVCSRSGNMQLT
jgi:hypothetical protein